MTPLKINMMLHYYAIAEPYSMHNPAHARSPAVDEQRKQLIDDDLLECAPASDSGYRVTERGKAYIAALMRMPLPQKTWIIPQIKAEIYGEH